MQAVPQEIRFADRRRGCTERLARAAQSQHNCTFVQGDIYSTPAKSTIALPSNQRETKKGRLDALGAKNLFAQPLPASSGDAPTWATSGGAGRDFEWQGGGRYMGFESKGRSGVSNVSHTTLSAKTPGIAGSTVAERARAKRAADPVCIEMPVRVRGIGGLPMAGSGEIGQEFVEDTRTLIVMAPGAVVRMATRVKKGQLHGLKHLSTWQEVSCRVVNVRSSGTPEDYAEVEFTQRAVGFWGIHFPNDPKDQPPAEAPTAGEVEAERVIFGGGHTERGNVNVAPSTAGAAAQDAKAGTRAGGKADPKPENAPFGDLVKPEPLKAAPVDSPGFSGLSKSAEQGAASAERVLRDDAIIQQQQAQRNVISFPGPTTHQEKANILAGPQETTLAAKLDFSPVIEEPAAKQAPSDAEIEHAAIARAIEEKAAREKTEAAARDQATDDVEVAPSHDEKRRDTRAEGKAAPSETRRRSAAARPRRSLRMSIGATAHGTLEEEIQRDRAALKNTK